MIVGPTRGSSRRAGAGCVCSITECVKSDRFLFDGIK